RWFTLFPYTTLFRSVVRHCQIAACIFHDLADSHGIADPGITFRGIQQHDGVIATIDLGEHDQTFAGLVDEARLGNTDVPVVATQDRKSTRLNSSHVK